MAEGGETHRDQAEADAEGDALAGDAGERLPIETAVATRSMRSTVITASAVSEETVAPGPHRDPDVGERQGPVRR
jgi:hypothetical protein